MQLVLSSPRFEEIRRIVLDFLSDCNMEYPRDVRVDAAFEEDCHFECIRRGYDMETLSPFLRVGIDISAISYWHLEDYRIKIYIALYTALFSYMDDLGQTEEGMKILSSFVRRFIHNEPQQHKMLDDVADILKEAHAYWPPITASLIITSSFKFISALFLDIETKGMKFDEAAVQYPPYLRLFSGDPESYVVFTFPPEMPASHYAQAIPDMCDVANYVNDILSFYKEELQDEDSNYIALYGKTKGLGKIDALKQIARDTAKTHKRILSLLDGEAKECYKVYCEGYIAFHTICPRYRLDELVL